MGTKDTGPLDWRIAMVDKAGRPTPEFQRRWATQRNNNALIGSITAGVGAPTGTPDDGAEYVDTSTTPFTLYVGENNAWHQVGAVKFLDLSDVPHSYSGQGLKLVRVNAGATALEFVAAVVGANPTGTGSDTVTNGTATTFMRSDATFPIQLSSSSQFGLVKVDGTTITAAGGVISSAGGGGGGGHKYEAFGALPGTGTFTGYNMQTGSVFASSTASLILSTLSSGFQINAQWQAAPSTPYDLYARMNWTGVGGASRGGLAVMNSSNNKFASLMFSGTANNIVVIHDTGPTTFNATLITMTTVIGINWLRINNNGTNLTFYVSADGLNWLNIFTETLASFIGTADRLALINFAGNTGPPSALWCGSFGTTAPS